mgnify:CR=1 FL=1
MRADMIVLLEPAIDDHLGLVGGRKPCSAEHLATQRAVKTLIVISLPFGDQSLCLPERPERVSFGSSSRSRPLNDSTNALCRRAQGSN